MGRQLRPCEQPNRPKNEIFNEWNTARNALKHHGKESEDVISLNLFDEAYWMIKRALSNANKLGISIGKPATAEFFGHNPQGGLRNSCRECKRAYEKKQHALKPELTAARRERYKDRLDSAQDFLESLGIPEEEIGMIRKFSAGKTMYG